MAKGNELAVAYVTLIPSFKGLSAGIKRELSGGDITSVMRSAGDDAGGAFVAGFDGADISSVLDGMSRDALGREGEFDRAGVRLGDAVSAGVADGVASGGDPFARLTEGLDAQVSDAARSGRRIGDATADGVVDGVRSGSSGVGGALDSELRSVDGRAPGRRIGGDVGDGLADGFDPDLSGDVLGDLDSLATGAAVAGVGAIVGQLFLDGFTTAVENGAANAKLAAQLDLSEDESARLGGIAGDLWASNWGDSVGEVNETIRATLAAGLLPGGLDASNQAIEDTTAKVLALSDAFDQDPTQIARAAGQLVRTDLASDATEALDVVAAGFQRTGDLSGDFLDTLSEYSTQFRKLGIDGEAAVGLISQGLEAGARDSDKVADALKEFSIRAVDGSELTAQSFRDLGLDAEAMAAQIGRGGPEAASGLDTVLDRLRSVEDPVKRAQIAVGLFGTQSEDLGDALGALDLSPAVDEFESVEGAADRVGEKLTDSVANDVETGKRALTSRFSTFFDDVFAGLGGDVGGIVDAASSLVSGRRITEEFAAFRGLLDDPKAAWDEFVGSITGTAEQIPAAIAGILPNLGGAAQNISGVWGSISEAARSGLSSLGGIVADTVGSVVGTIASLPGRIGELAGLVFTAAGNLGSAIIDGIGSALGGAVDFVSDVASKIGSALKRFINDQVIDRLNRALEIEVNLPLVGKVKINPPDIPRFATGGVVPGSGTGDTVPAWLTPGEFVIRRAVVESLGVDTFAAINAGIPVTVNRRRFADGGLVGASPRAALRPVDVPAPAAGGDGISVSVGQIVAPEVRQVPRRLVEGAQRAKVLMR